MLVMTGDRDFFSAQASTEVSTSVRARGGPSWMRPAEVRKRHGDRSSARARLHRAAGRSVRWDPGREGHRRRRPPRSCITRHGSLEAALEGALRESKPSVRRALLDAREELLRFREIATLQGVDVEPPPDGPTDYAGAAAAARERGMNRLAERLEKAATSG